VFDEFLGLEPDADLGLGALRGIRSVDQIEDADVLLVGVLVGDVGEVAADGAGSGIDGTVTIGPMCPAERIESACPDQPVEAGVTVASGNRIVAHVQSDRSGSFQVLLSPGTYQLDAVSIAPPARRAPEQAVTVSAGRLTPVHLRIDSGIR